MYIIQLELTGLLLCVLSMSAFAEHRRPPHPESLHVPHQLSAKYIAIKAKPSYHASTHARAHHHQHEKSYQRYHDRIVYRNVKHHRVSDYRYQRAYRKERHAAYHLIASTIVLSEALRHIHY